MRKSFFRKIILLSISAVVINLAGVSLIPDAINADTDPVNNEHKAYVEGEVIVRFKAKFNNIQGSALSKDNKLSLQAKLPEANTQLLKINSSESVDRVIASLEESGAVELAQPNYLYYADSIDSGDAHFSELWGLNNTGQGIKEIAGKNDIDIDAPEAWAYTKNLNEVIVAVIDSGIDIHHPDLAGNTVPGWDFYHDDSSVYDEADGDQHGTHIAGIIAAKTNSLGVRGVTANVKIMPIKFLGPGNIGTTYGAIQAINYAKEHGAQVINASWSSAGGAEDVALNEAIADSGAVFVASAGNAGQNNDSNPSSPANLAAANIITVAAVDNKGGLAYFSNYGASNVDVAAPGVDILSTIPASLQNTGGSDYANAYQYYSGTSMAAPYVTGIAGVLFGQKHLTIAETIKLIKDSGIPLKALQGKTDTGKMVNLANAVKTQVSKPTITMTTSTSGSSAGYQISFRTGEFGSLTTGDKLQLVFTNGMSFQAGHKIKLAGIEVPSESKEMSNTLIIPVPAPIAHNSLVTLTLDNVRNPPPGSYQFSASTAADPVHISSNPYTIIAPDYHLQSPVLQKSMVEGHKLQLQYDQALNEASVPYPEDFQIAVSSEIEPSVMTSVYVENVAIVGKDVRLTLKSAVLQDQNVSLSYFPGASPIVSLFNNQAADVVNESILNGLGAPELISAVALSNETVMVTFDQAMDETSVENLYGSYAINNGLQITDAQLQQDHKKVLLTTSAQTGGIQYQIKAFFIIAESGKLIRWDRSTAGFNGMANEIPLPTPPGSSGPAIPGPVYVSPGNGTASVPASSGAAGGPAAQYPSAYRLIAAVTTPAPASPVIIFKDNPEGLSYRLSENKPVDSAVISEAAKLLAGKPTRLLTLLLPETESGAAAPVQFYIKDLLALAEQLPDALIELRGAANSFLLPVQLIDYAALKNKVSTATFNKFILEVSMGQVDGVTKESFVEALGASGTLISPIIKFSTSLGINGNQELLTDFNGKYVSRSFELEQQTNVQDLTVVTLDEDTGKAVFVPAVFQTINGITKVTLMSPHNSSYAVVRLNTGFADLTKHWAKADIELLAAKGIVQGTEAGSFGPNVTISRAEFAVLLSRALGLKTDKQAATALSDLSPEQWYAGSVGAIVKAGVVSGFKNGSFGPYEQVTREQMAVMLGNALSFLHASVNMRERQDILLAKLADQQSISNWAIPAVAMLLDTGIINGRAEHTFAPQAYVSRAEAAAMLVRFLRFVHFID